MEGCIPSVIKGNQREKQKEEEIRKMYTWDSNNGKWKDEEKKFFHACYPRYSTGLVA
jgi:hypothetical protein